MSLFKANPRPYYSLLLLLPPPALSFLPQTSSFLLGAYLYILNFVQLSSPMSNRKQRKSKEQKLRQTPSPKTLTPRISPLILLQSSMLPLLDNGHCKRVVRTKGTANAPTLSHHKEKYQPLNPFSFVHLPLLEVQAHPENPLNVTFKTRQSLLPSIHLGNPSSSLIPIQTPFRATNKSENRLSIMTTPKETLPSPRLSYTRFQHHRGPLPRVQSVNSLNYR